MEQLSLDLKAEFPSEKGFSARNLWYMKQWYLYYSTPEATEKLHQPGAEFPYVFAFIPWRHLVEIVTGCKTIDESLYYVRNAITNFKGQLTPAHAELAQEMIKENYDLSFVSLAREHHPVPSRFVKMPEDNPTLGILICSGFDQTEAELTFQGMTNPLALATYNGMSSESRDVSSLTIYAESRWSKTKSMASRCPMSSRPKSSFAIVCASSKTNRRQTECNIKPVLEYC